MVIMKKKSRLLAILLALAMIVTYMPVLAFANGDGNNQTFDVDEDVFYSNGVDLNSHRAIPGMTLKMKANVYDWAWDDDPVKAKPFTYTWTLKGVDRLRYWVQPEDGEGYYENLTGYNASDFVALDSSGQTVSANFKTKDVVKSEKSIIDEADIRKLDSAYDMGFRINFKVTATRDGESHDREFDIWVSNDYYEVEPIGNPLEEMICGSSVTVEPKLFHHTGVDQKNQVENVEWKLAKYFGDDRDDPWDDGWTSIVPLDAQDKDFPVTGPREGKYTITRKTFNEARIVLWAEYKASAEADPVYEDADYWVDEQEKNLSRYQINVEEADSNNAVRVSQLNNISLNVSVSDGRFTLPATAYDLHIFKQSWSADDKQILTPVNNGELTLDAGTGTATFIIYASAKEGSGYTGQTSNDRYFDVYYNKTLYPFNPEIEFEGYESHDGERPMSRYYWFSTNEAPAVSEKIKVSIGGSVLNEGTDYTVHYFAGDGDEPDERQILDTFPTTAGTYSLLIKAVPNGTYIGKNDTVKIIIMDGEGRQAQVAAENVRNLIERIEVWFGPEGMNRSKVKPARDAYDALSSEAKKLVYDRWYAQLEDAEFIILMDAVDVNNPSEAAVKAARAQYDKASKVNMFEYWMPEELVEKLKAAEKKIADNKAAQEKAAEAARQGVVDKAVAKVKISKPVAAKKAVTVKWNKLNSKDKKKASNIEIWICPNKKFSAADTKIVTVGKGKSSKKIKGLKAKTKYYVKVRAIKKVGGVKHYKAWSKVKSVKTK